MRVMVSSEHALLREGLRDLLRRWSGIEVVGVAPAPEDVMLMAGRLQPDILVLVPGGSPKRDTAAVAAVRAQARSCRIICLAPLGPRRATDDIGADRLVPASVGLPGLVQLMWEAHTDARPATPERGAGRPATRGAKDEEPRQLLTRREYDVVHAVCQGLTNKQVGRRLSISEKTVKNHLSSVYRRIELTGRTELVTWAIRRGLVDVADGALAEDRSSPSDHSPRFRD